MSRGTLKLFAILAMVGNHIAQLFLVPDSISYHLFLTLGYVTAPLMCAFLSDGFTYTRDRKRYFLRLVFFALVSELPFYFAFGHGGNMGITLALSFLALLAWEKGRKDVSLLAILATGWSDWSFLAPVFMIMIHQAERKRKQEALAFGAGTFLFALICLANGESPLHTIGFLLAGILRVAGYNGEKGNVPGWLFYGFYPVHLFLLAWIARWPGIS